ncbi:hypothetical protein JD844_006648 [Phrynosoma platyrhinos]|uniref:FHA domain-containing protein n=1 Tax=Phrynosoma platyrhinos TaxID=52577 RepID=A0ABQ7T1Y6_PHRPL|nr:hypothetical protein JD844_006648 [Phrynosoma platyrhinos]
MSRVRKKECDIRIQIPLVSKEHCKIEVNENKEATLFNLSSATPTQLNGINVQDPTYLKHGDVLTIIDRSFRFEYPPLSPRKRISRSQEKETLQVLHVQQEEQELLHPQDSENKNPQISEKKHEWRSEVLNISEKKRTKEHTGQYGTYESPYKICRPENKNEMSPFSKLYELMKYESSAKNTEENAVSTPQKGYSPQKYGNAMPQAASQVPGRSSVASQTKTEAEIWNGVSHSGNVKGQGINSQVSNPVCFDKNSSRRSSGRRYATKQKEGGEDVNQLNICNTEENELEKSKVTDSANIVFRATRQSTKYFPQSCCITSLDSTETTRSIKTVEQIIEKADIDTEAKVADPAESDEGALLTPKSKRDIFQSHSSLYARNVRSPLKFRMKQVELDSLIEMNCYSGTSSEIEEYSAHTCMEGHESNNMVENMCPKVMESNSEMTTEVIHAQKETKMENSSSHIPKDGNCRSVASPHHGNKSKSPRMNTEQNKQSSNISSFIKLLTTEELLVIPADPSGTGRITPVKMHDVGRDRLQEEEDKIKKSTTKDCDQNIDTKNVSMSSNLSENGDENGIEVPDEAVSESNMSSPLIIKSEIKKSPQKRKSRELLTQPLGKRKRVSFGGHLSPELFDKRLPPNSPLKKAASPPAHRSPVTSLLARRSLATSPPAVIVQRKGRFSVTNVTCPPAEEQYLIATQDPIATHCHLNEEFTEVKTPESTDPVSKAASSVRRSKKYAPRRSSLRRSGTINPIHSKRRSGASGANLMVAKSWAEVVKQGVPKSQIKTTKTCGIKRKSPKKIPTKLSKNNISMLKTPIRKIKGHFTTGHANSPAPILIGKAHSNIMNLAAQVPKVMFNYPLKQQHNLNESFTGMAEMFMTPMKTEEKSSLSSGQKATPEVKSEMHFSGESGEASTTPSSISNQLRLQDIASPLLNEMSQVSSLDRDDLQMTPIETSSNLKVAVRKNSSPVDIDETAGVEDTNPAVEDKKLKAIVELSTGKRILRTPKQKPETMEALSGLRRLLRTPKQNPEPVEALSGVKRILRTPKQKMEPVEALSGVKRIFRTPKQKPESVDALSGVKRMMRTPKQKMEPVEALSGVKRILRTPKQIIEPDEALSGVKRILRTPKQKTEPDEALSGIKRIFRTPKQETEPAKVFPGISMLLRTPKENLDPVADDIICSKLIKTPEALMGSSEKKQIIQPTKVHTDEIPKEKVIPLDDMEEIQRQLRTPMQSSEPIEDLVGISQLFKTPRQKYLPVDDYFGLQKLMAESKQTCVSPDIDYTGLKEMLSSVDEHKGEIQQSANIMKEDNGLCINSSNKLESLENEAESKDAKLETSTEIKIPFTIVTNDYKCDVKLEDNPLNELKIEATETVCMPESCQPDDTESQNADRTGFVKEPVADLGPKDEEMSRPLASGRRTRKQKVDESTTTIEQTRKVQKRTRNFHRAKSDKSVKSNDSFEQSITDSSTDESLMPVIESVNKISSREESRKLVIDTNSNIQNKDFETSEVDIIGSSTCKRNTRGKAIPVKTESKTSEVKGIGNSICKRNTRGKAIAIKTENQTSEIESTGNSISKRITRGKAIPVKTEIEILNRAINEYKSGSTKCTVSKICKIEALESNTTEVQENAVRRGKGKKVNFLLEINNSMSLEDKCVLGDNSIIPEEERSSFSESSTSSAKEKTSRRSKKKASVISQQLCCSLSEEKHTEICGNKDKKGIKSSFENITHTKDDPLVVSSNFFKGKTVQEIQVEENPNETQNVPLESSQTLAVHSPLKKQDIAEENLPRRGRNRQTISHEVCTEYDSKQSAAMKKQKMSVSSEEKQPKRGRGRRVVPPSQIPLPLESITLAKESPKQDHISSSQTEYSLQQIQKEENPNETPKEPVGSIQTSTEHHPARRQKAAKVNPPRTGRSKQGIAHETSTEYDSRKATEVVDCNMGVPINENQQKRVRRKRGLPLFQEEALTKESPASFSFSSAKGGEFLLQIQKEGLPSESPKVPREVVQTLEEHSPPKRQKEAKEYLPRRGRRKEVISHEISTEFNRKHAVEISDHVIVVTKEENQLKRGRGKRSVPVFQTPPLRENPAFSKEGPKTDSFNSAQGECSLQQIPNEANVSETQETSMESAEHSPPKRFKIAQEDPPRRGRRKAAYQETMTECERKQAAVTVVKNADSTKKNESKRDRRRKIVPASQALFSPLKNNSLTLSPTSEVEQPSSVGETAAIASESLPRKSSRRKKDGITATGSVPANKESKLFDKGKEEKISEDVQDLAKENVSKRGRRKQLVREILSNNQLGNSKNTISINDKTLHFEIDFEKKTQSKRNQEEENVLASELLPSLKVSITLPSSSSDKGRTASENPSALVENVGKGKKAKYGRNNNKIAECATSVRRNNKHTEEVFQENDLEKKTLANEKQYRRGRKKGNAFESTISVSLKEKDGLSVGSCAASEDQQEVLENTASSKKVASYSRGRKGKMSKDINKNNTLHKDQNSDSEFSAQVAKKNSTKLGRRKQDKNGSETSDVAENKLKSKKAKFVGTYSAPYDKRLEEEKSLVNTFQAEARSWQASKLTQHAK